MWLTWPQVDDHYVGEMVDTLSKLLEPENYPSNVFNLENIKIAPRADTRKVIRMNSFYYM